MFGCIATLLDLIYHKQSETFSYSESIPIIAVKRKRGCLYQYGEHGCEIHPFAYYLSFIGRNYSEIWKFTRDATFGHVSRI